MSSPDRPPANVARSMVPRPISNSGVRSRSNSITASDREHAAAAAHHHAAEQQQQQRVPHLRTIYSNEDLALEDFTPNQSPLEHSLAARHPHAPSQSPLTLHDSPIDDADEVEQTSLLARHHSHGERDSDNGDDDDVPSSNRSRTPPHWRAALRHRFNTSPFGRCWKRMASTYVQLFPGRRGRIVRAIFLTAAFLMAFLLAVNFLALAVRLSHSLSASCSGISRERFRLPMAHVRHPSHCAASFDSQLSSAPMSLAPPPFGSLYPMDAPPEATAAVASDALVSNIVHFIYGLDTTSPTLPPFSLIAHLSMAAAFNIQRAERIYLHHIRPPHGPWWEATRKLLGEKLVMRTVPPISAIFGRPIYIWTDHSDFLRLEVLRTFGGIYLDFDIILVRPIDDLRRFRVVLSEEVDRSSFYNRVSSVLGHGVGGWYSRARGISGLTNKFIIAEPRSRFIEAWYQQYRAFHHLEWDYFCCKVPLLLSEKYPNTVVTLAAPGVLLPQHAQLAAFFRAPSKWTFDDHWAVHVWGHYAEKTFLDGITHVEQLWPPDERVSPSFLHVAKAALGIQPIRDSPTRLELADLMHV